MKKIKLNENDIERLVKKIIKEEDDFDWMKGRIFTWDKLNEGDVVSIHSTSGPLTDDGRSELHGVVLSKNEMETCIKLDLSSHKDMVELGTHWCFDDNVDKFKYYFKKHS